jgi:hypothetical protein
MPVLYAIARYLGFGGCVARGFLVYYEGVPGAAKLQLPDNWHVVGGFGLADVPLVGDLVVGRVEAYSAEQVRIAKATMVSAYEYGALEAQLNKERDLRLKGAQAPQSIASAPTPLSAPNNQTMTTWNRRSRTMKRNWLTLTAAALLPIFVSGCGPSDRMNAAAEIKGRRTRTFRFLTTRRTAARRKLTRHCRITASWLRLISGRGALSIGRTREPTGAPISTTTCKPSLACAELVARARPSMGRTLPLPPR